METWEPMKKIIELALTHLGISSAFQDNSIWYQNLEHKLYLVIEEVRIK